MIGGGNPIYGSVFFEPVLRASLAILDHSFFGKCKFCEYEEGKRVPT